MTPGSRIGRYEISRLLGTGGMGEVYLARDTRLRRPVAIKLLLAKYTQSRERLSRFEHEAYAASSLNHPNILTIHEIGDAEGCRFITSEYVEGESLRHHMSSGRMELTKIVEVTVQVASALEAAHEAGIVHRDIKPENIMLRTDGFVKVLDFGIAKLNERPWKLNHINEALTSVKVLTVSAMRIRTVSYISPEQLSAPSVDGRKNIL